MKPRFIAFFLILCASFHLPGAARAQSRVIEAGRMQRDLDIMERVLERLLNENTAALRWTGPAARGVYLPEFGVLFQVPKTFSHFSYFEFQEEGGGDARRASTSTHRMLANEATSGFETGLLEFFSRYADAIGQLRSEDRIAVYRGMGPEFAIFLNFPGAVRERIHASNEEALAWVRKADVEALQTGKLKDEDFKKRVIFAHAEVEEAANTAERKEIDTLAGLFEAALGRHPASGIYLENYGAVFFTSVDFNNARSRGRELNNVPASEGGRFFAPETIEDYLRATERVHRERAKNWQSEYVKFKEKLFDAVADYGHTLRSLRPEDRLVVVADLPNAPEQQPRQLVCTVKKQHVEQYYNRKIAPEQLRKAMTFYEN